MSKFIGAAIVAASVALTSVAATPAAAFEAVAVTSGIAGVRDGDDVTFGQVPVRLQGIAAPEDGGGSREPGGPEGTENLRAIAEGQFVVCHLDGTTAGTNRAVGICYVGLTDLGRYQVESGHARDCPAYSGGRYASAEQAARDAGNDLGAIYDLPAYCEPK